ncbi:MAG: prepilin-type N-terminal cleavage/methylation domain-containing protein [Ruminiclostridium sp.]|nr:prepilin-type N-terminal cleavage/methylation domain-containing protein [Ruminiclostridium sp.]
MKKLLSKKAFTLVEVIIATAIMGLLIAAVMALFGPVRDMIKDMDGDVNINNTTDTIQDYFHARLNKSIGYNIDIYDGTAEALLSDKDGSIGQRVDSMRAAAAGDDSISTYCILLRYETDGYYIYDFGKVDSGLDYDKKKIFLGKQRLFNKEYYRDARYRFTFKTIEDSTTGQYWYQMGITPYDTDGNLLLETRTSTIKMLNTKSTPQSKPELETEDYIDVEAGTTPTIAIIYNIKNYKDLNNLPEAP